MNIPEHQKGFDMQTYMTLEQAKVNAEVAEQDKQRAVSEEVERERERCAKICEFHSQQGMANAIREGT